MLPRSSVKADRPNVTPFFLRDETDRAERRFQSEVEEILDADVYTLDLREAASLVAMRHPDEWPRNYASGTTSTWSSRRPSRPVFAPSLRSRSRTPRLSRRSYVNATHGRRRDCTPSPAIIT